jgi:hypothetical protein
VNLLCILGAVVGLAALFLPWMWTAEGLSSVDWSAADVLKDGGSWSLGSIHTALIIFTTGTIMALAVPSGGIVQAIGLAMFYSEEVLREERFTSGGVMQAGLSIGVFVAILSTAVVIAGLVSPTGPGHGTKHNWWSSRALTFARTRVSKNRVVRLSWAKPREVFAVVRRPSRKATARLVAVFAVASIAYAAAFSYQDDGAARRVGDGVLLSMGELRMGHDWDNSRISVSDGVNQVQWNLTTDIWEHGAWTAVAFEPKDLGDVELRLTVVDWGGDGYCTLGDQIVLAPINESAFEDDVQYILVLSDPREFSATDIPSIRTVVTFVLQSDGGVDSDWETTVSGGWVVFPERTPWITSIIMVSITSILSLTSYYMLIRAAVKRERRASVFDEPS